MNAGGDSGEADAAARERRRAQRQRLLGERAALPIGEHRRASGAIAARLTGLVQQLKPSILAGYWPIRREFDPLPLLRAWRAAGLTVALPHVCAKDAPLEFRRWDAGARMTRGVYDIPYPAEGIVVQPDALLVPMLGFDAAAYRLGYGGGYYDRTAAILPAATLIGIAFEQARLPGIEPLAHDIPMHWVITEAGQIAGRV